MIDHYKFFQCFRIVAHLVETNVLMLIGLPDGAGELQLKNIMAKSAISKDRFLMVGIFFDEVL